jgi:ferritin
MNGKMQNALNGQINAELYSSYLYLGMSTYFQSIDLNGFAHWMRIQAQEELGHAVKFYDYIQDRQGKVELKTISAPPAKWESPLAAFKDAHAHEQKITALIGKLVDLALAERDHATNTFLQWFVSEQVEEESNAKKAIDSLKIVGKDGSGLFLLDREMSQRIFQPATGAETGA